MKIKDILDKIGCEVIAMEDPAAERKIERIVVSDLMSDVLVADEVDLLVTSLVSTQALRTADIVGAHTVLIVNDKPVLESLKDMAAEFDITLLKTKLPTFEAAAMLHRLHREI